MQLQDAISLIEKGVVTYDSLQTWADLGAGNGLFSRALVSILPPGSIVHAVDIQKQNIGEHHSSIVFHQANFATDTLRLPMLNGILMANSLHYVKEPVECIQRLKSYLVNTAGKFILVEYDTDRANQWVPFPVSFSHAQEIFREAGFLKIEKIAERPSVFRSDLMYAAVIG